MSKIYIVFLSFCLFALNVFGQDVEYLINEGKQLEKGAREPEALLKYQEALKLAPADLTALVKCSEMSTVVGARQKDKAKQMEYFNAAVTYAQSALQQNEKDEEANNAMAAALGIMALVNSGKEKVKNVKDIKKYADAALAANPNSTKALHILGKWNLEVASLNFAEKAAVKVIYGGLPPASLPDAISYFEKARAKDPSFILNYLELAKAYKENNQTDKAIEVLNRMVKLPPKTGDDPGYKAEGKKLLESLQ